MIYSLLRNNDVLLRSGSYILDADFHRTIQLSDKVGNMARGMSGGAYPHSRYEEPAMLVRLLIGQSNVAGTVVQRKLPGQLSQSHSLLRRFPLLSSDSEGFRNIWESVVFRLLHPVRCASFAIRFLFAGEKGQELYANRLMTELLAGPLCFIDYPEHLPNPWDTIRNADETIALHDLVAALTFWKHAYNLGDFDAMVNMQERLVLMVRGDYRADSLPTVTDRLIIGAHLELYSGFLEKELKIMYGVRRFAGDYDIMWNNDPISFDSKAFSDRIMLARDQLRHMRDAFFDIPNVDMRTIKPTMRF